MCVDVRICIHCFCSSLRLKPLAPAVPEVHQWGSRGAKIQLLLSLRLVLLLGLQLLDKDLFLRRLLLGLLLQMLS